MNEPEKTAKQIFEESLVVEKKNQEFVSTLSEESQKKHNAVNAARKIMDEAGVPFWLFADLPVSEFMDLYMSFQGTPQDFDEKGNLSKSGEEFIRSHNTGLAYCCFDIFEQLRVEANKRFGKEIIPSYSDVIEHLAEEYAKEMEILAKEVEL